MPKLLNTHSDTDEIILYLQGESKKELSPKLLEKLERLETCAGLIRQHGSRHKVVRMMRNIFGKGNESDYSRATAYRDFEDTQLVYGQTPKHSRGMWLDILLGMMMESRKKALAAGDFRAVASIESNMQKTVKELMGDEKGDPYEGLEIPKPVVGFFPELTGIKLPPDEELWAIIEKLKKPKKTIDISNISDADLAE